MMQCPFYSALNANDWYDDRIRVDGTTPIQ